jgi:hypothetical protein
MNPTLTKSLLGFPRVQIQKYIASCRRVAAALVRRDAAREAKIAVPGAKNGSCSIA